MKKIIILYFAYFFLIITNCFSQTGWIKSYVGSTSNVVIHFFNQNTGLLINLSGIIYKSTNCGVNWINTSTINSGVPSAGYFFDENNYVLAGSTNNHIFGWVGIINNGILNNYYFSPLYNYLGFESTDWINVDTGYISGNDMSAGGPYGRAFRTINRGLNWTEITPNANLYINCLKFIDANTGFIIEPRFKKTTNMGDNWFSMNDTSGLDLHIVNSDTIYIAGYWGRVNISTNGGLTWSARNTNIINLSIRRIRFLNSKTGWVCGDGTIMKTTNAGINWQLQLSGTNIHLADLFVLNENYLWAVGDTGYAAGIVFRTTTGGVTFIKNISNEQSLVFKMFQNYPNPFNSMTNVKWQMLNSGNAKIVVFDILGKEVTTLVNNNLKSGIYEVTFDGSNLSSGIYYYSFFSDGKLIDTKRTVLIK